MYGRHVTGKKGRNEEGITWGVKRIFLSRKGKKSFEEDGPEKCDQKRGGRPGFVRGQT